MFWRVIVSFHWLEEGELGWGEKNNWVGIDKRTDEWMDNQHFYRKGAWLWYCWVGWIELNDRGVHEYILAACIHPYLLP